MGRGPTSHATAVDPLQGKESTEEAGRCSVDLVNEEAAEKGRCAGSNDRVGKVVVGAKVGHGHMAHCIVRYLVGYRRYRPNLIAVCGVIVEVNM